LTRINSASVVICYCYSLLYGVTEYVIRRVELLQMTWHASLPEPYVVTTLRRCCVSCTGFLFGGEWSLNLPVWCARHCAVKCLHTWLMISISSPKTTDGPFGLPLITRVRCHVHVWLGHGALWHFI